MNKEKKDKPICIMEVNENLRRVELGMELTRPLRQLNTHCEFKKKYDEFCNRKYGRTEEYRAKQREYYRTHPEYKAKRRECMRKYYQTMRKYYQTPEYRAKRREYYRTHPEYRAKRREYMRKYYQTYRAKHRE